MRRRAILRLQSCEPASNTDTQYPVGGLNPGTGVVMAQGGTQWGPGNFGFLDQLGKARTVSRRPSRPTRFSDFANRRAT